LVTEEEGPADKGQRPYPDDVRGHIHRGSRSALFPLAATAAAYHPIRLFGVPFVLIPGILITRGGRNIIKRDNIYGAFIRSLGRASSVSGQTMGEAVRKLAMHKFGPLTSMVKNLSKRLALNINSVDAWKHFSAKSSSNMIRSSTECTRSACSAEPSPR
jgi:archaellum biogenesis protein FlaJ (TadC family)